MYPRSILRMIVVILCFVPAGVRATAQTLRVVTLNCWTGLDYNGRTSVGEYETAETREARFAMQVAELRRGGADLVALQEVNPADDLADRFADSLGFDVVSIRTNSGLKVGAFGIPANLNEGLAILARKSLRLRFFDVWELSDGFGAFGDVLTIHWSERNAALVARVSVNDRDCYILNTHLTASVPRSAAADSVVEVLIAREHLSGEAAQEFRSEVARLAGMRPLQVARLKQHMDRSLTGAPVILAGDFNAPPDSPDLEPILGGGEFFDAASYTTGADQDTWDPARNENITYSTALVDARGNPLSPSAALAAWYDLQPKRLDAVFAGPPFRPSDVLDGMLVCEKPVNGLYSSDHYGQLVELRVPWGKDSLAGGIPLSARQAEFFPILSYDTDVGFGVGAKAFVLNALGMNESFDVVAFNSSKGERWYRLVFSWPDFELRQGRIYPFALDVVMDYDKYIRNNFFGVGNTSRYKDRESYTREPLELTVAVSRGWTETAVSQAAVKYRTVRNFNFDTSSALATLPPSLNAGTARVLSLLLTHRYDTRDSYINPSRGVVLQAELEHAFGTSLTNVSGTRYAAVGQYYTTLFYPRTVLAFRGALAFADGENLPVQALLSVGGTNTLRGSPQDRFLDRVSGVINAEVRFPLVWRFGLVAGIDAGRVWHRPSEIGFSAWSSNPVVGLRFYMDTFVVRADLGFGAETTGFYLNFGHLF